MENYETLKSLIDGAMPVVEIWKAETPAQEVWKEKWLRQAREVVDKPKEYCCTCEPHFESRGTALCSICHKPYTKPIKTEKIKELKFPIWLEDKKWTIIREVYEILQGKINELIGVINDRI